MSPRRAGSEQTYDDRLFDLEYLRKGPGLTPGRLRSRPGVLALLGTDDPVEGAKRLDALMGELDQDRRCEALRAAFGYGRGVARLAERRSAFAQDHGKSPDTIRDWEDEAIGELLLILLAESPVPAMPTPNFLMEYMSADYVIDGRHFVRATHRRDLVVLAPEAGHFRYGISEDVDVDKVVGAEASVDDRTPTGPIYRFRFPKVLGRGGRHSIGWEEVRKRGVTSPGEVVHDFASQIFHMPTRRYEVSVTFKGEIPRTVWRFEQLAQAERPGRPSPSTTLRPDAGGTFSTSFEGLYGGFCSGIAWRW